MTSDNLTWRRASFCGSGACVEVAQTADGTILIRDGKNPAGGTLTVTAEQWTDLRDGIKDGEFDQ